MLLFKKKFLEPIRRGEKTQTIRFWKYRRMKAGQRSYIPGIGYISILSVVPVELEHLTDSDAVPDGFETADLLKAELFSLYAAEIERGFHAYRIRFSVFPPKIQRQMQAEKKRLNEKKTLEKSVSAEKSNERIERTLAELRRIAMEDVAMENVAGSSKTKRPKK